mgnify:CR=1 FL=1
MIKVSNLKKSYMVKGSKKSPFSLKNDRKIAVKDVSFECLSGQCTALIGPNGAGKTTTLLNILGLAKSDGGTIEFKSNAQKQSLSYKQLYRSLGFFSGHSKLEFGCSVKTMLEYYMNIYNTNNTKNVKDLVEKSIAKFELEEFAQRPCYSLSSGQKTLAHFARANIHEPIFLILDEPTAFTDPYISQKIVEQLNSLKKLGTTMLITSHNMSEVKNVADKIVFIKDGATINEVGADAPSLLAKFGTDDLEKIWLDQFKLGGEK